MDVTCLEPNYHLKAEPMMAYVLLNTWEKSQCNLKQNINIKKN